MMQHILIVKIQQKKTFFDKILIDKAFETAKNSKNNGYQRALASMLYKFFDDKTGSRVRVNGQLFEELHKPVNQQKTSKLVN